MNPAWKQAALLKVGEVFRTCFLDNSLEISESTSPLDIAEWDSLAHISLLSMLEKTFDIRFSIDEIAEADTVNKILSCMYDKGVSLDVLNSCDVDHD